MDSPTGPSTSPPNPAHSCSECGGVDLLTPVRLLPPGKGDGEASEKDGPPHTVLLCPSCLSESLNHWRSKGGKIEARLDGGRVVRW